MIPTAAQAVNFHSTGELICSLSFTRFGLGEVVVVVVVCVIVVDGVVVVVVVVVDVVAMVVVLVGMVGHAPISHAFTP